MGQSYKNLVVWSTHPAGDGDAVTILEQEERKIALLAEVRKVLGECADVDFTSLEALRAAKTILSDAINVAKEARVPEGDLLEAERRRRKIHNGIEDLKGTIRVFARVRPLSEKERLQGDTNVTKQVDNMTLSLQQLYNNVNYAFDAVFTPGTQDEVFEDCSDLVQSAVDGFPSMVVVGGCLGASGGGGGERGCWAGARFVKGGIF